MRPASRSEFVLEAQIETQGSCNAACNFCPYAVNARSRAAKKMPEYLFYKIADEMATIPEIEQVKLMGLNEPLLDKRLETFIAHFKKVAPQIAVTIYTNGLLLTPARHDSLRAAGLDFITVSLNAVREKQHETITRMKGKFDRICANVDYAIAHKPHARSIDVHAVMSEDFSQRDVEEFYARWGDVRYGGHGLVVHRSNWAGTDQIAPAPTDPRRHFFENPNEWCWRATTQLYILYDGRVAACCFDPFGKMTFGDLNTQTIREVYNSERYTKFREDHANDMADKYEMCRNCGRI